MIYIKCFMCFLIFFLSTLLGTIFAKRVSDKTREYIQLKQIIMFIESKIRYTEDNLIDIFKSIAKDNENNNFGILFNAIYNKLLSSGMSLKKCIEISIDENKSLFQCDFKILLDLANNLGKKNVEEEIKNILFSKEQIDFCISSCKESEVKNIKLYRNLGVICGIMLVIVLI